MSRKPRRAAKVPHAVAEEVPPPDLRQLFPEAVELHQAGRLDEAEAIYRTILAIDAEQCDSLHLLGAIAHQKGQPELAVELIGKAIRINDRFPLYYSNLGNALRELGRLDEAAECYRKALEIDPGFAQAHTNLGNVRGDAGRLDEAAFHHRKALELNPNLVEAHYNLGSILKALGRPHESVAALRQALALRPDLVEAHVNLGNALRDTARAGEAIECYRRGIALKPDFAEAYLNLGNALRDQLQPDEAIACFRRATYLRTDYAEPCNNMGVVLREVGRRSEAAEAYHRALELRRDYPEAYSNLGNLLTDFGDVNEAVAAYEKALAITPDYAPAHTNLLLGLQYATAYSSDYLLAAAKRFGERYWRPAATSGFANHRNPGRRLRIGYFSPDFRKHSVAWFLEPLFGAHDRQAVEIFCYAEVKNADAMTMRFHDLADHWRNTVGAPDEAVAEQIRRDGIDILVDLAGHTDNNRLPVLALKPAPIQLTWLGYPGTTGLQTVDYRLVDAITDPEGEADGQASETLFRLPDGFLCYGPPSDAPEPMAAASTDGSITFGSFNNPAKLSPSTLDAWASLLTRLPNSRLLLKGISFSDPTIRALFH